MGLIILGQNYVSNGGHEPEGGLKNKTGKNERMEANNNQAHIFRKSL